MSTSQARNFGLLDRTNHQEFTKGPSPAPYPADAVAVKVADSFTSQTDLGHTHFQDPFAYYTAFLNTNDLPGYGANDDGNTCRSSALELQYTHYFGDQQQARARPAPYNLAVRLANRSNGVPLSTIIEQGSYSTVNSHSSPHSVDRFPSTRLNDSFSSNNYPHRASRSLDETALRKIEEDTNQEQYVCEDDCPNGKSEDDGGCLNLQQNTATPIKSSLNERQIPEISQSPKMDNNLECRGLKGFLRGVYHNVRGGSRHNGSRSSIMTNTSPSEFREGKLDTAHGIFRSQPEDGDFTINSVKQNAMWVSTHGDSLPLSSSPLPQDAPEREVRNRTSLSMEAERSAHSHPAFLQLPSAVSEGDAESPSLHFLQLPQLSSSPSEYAPSKAQRDVPREHTESETCTSSHRSRDELSTRYTFDGVPLYRTNAPSLREYDRAREASICSTISTTYSGTVLGIDLDLREYAPVARRSPTHVWVSPRQTSQSSATHSQKKDMIKSPYSITSSALPVLLPLAAASGIVRPNHATPKISFFSPSGNLIQAQDSSPTSTTSPQQHSSPTATYQKILCNPIGEPPVRPALVPLTTPPTTTAPLPAHLRHHHNYRHPAHSHIVPQPGTNIHTTIPTSTNVKGCGGVVRTSSLQPRSGVKQPLCTKGHKRYVSCSSLNLTSILNFDLEKVRCMRRPSLQFQHGIAVGRGKPTYTRSSPAKLQKRARKAHHTNSGPTTDYPTASTKPPLSNKLVPHPGHLLRVCFCQPWDGDENDTQRAKRVNPYPYPTESYPFPDFLKDMDWKGERGDRDGGAHEQTVRIVDVEKSAKGGEGGKNKRDRRRNSGTRLEDVVGSRPRVI